MSLKLLFFAQAADWVHCREAEMEVSEPKRLDDLINQHAKLQPLMNHRKALRVAINREFSTFQCEVNDGDEIAFIPPVSGG